MNLYLNENRLYNDATLKAAQRAYKRHRQMVTFTPVMISGTRNGAVGVVMQHANGLYLAGSERQGAGLSDTKPPRFYKNERYAQIAVAHLDIKGEFRPQYVHTT